MMSILIRNRIAFDSVKDLLTIDHFSDTERGFALVWRIATDYFEEWDDLPGQVLMFAEVRSALGEDPDFLTEAEREELEAWLANAYDDNEWDQDIETSESYAHYAVKSVKKHMTEHVAGQVQKEIKGQGRVVIDVSKFLSEHQQLQDRIESIGNDVDSCFAPEGWDTKGGIKMFSTGIEVFDKILGGGQSRVARRDVAHEDSHLAILDLSQPSAPLPRDGRRMPALLGNADGSKTITPSGSPNSVPTWHANSSSKGW